MRQLGLIPPSALTVSDLTRYLRALLESDEILQDVWVKGEISNLARPSSGHIYFSLKDENSNLRCVIWKINAARLRSNLENGMAVEAHGAVSLYERDGHYQLYVDDVREEGAGQLYLEFLRLKSKLEAEGLFDEARKRPLPPLPAVIGIATSPTGAALQDILNTLGNRYRLAEIVIAPCVVQGAEAPVQIVKALQALNRHVQPDVILVVRGGGSLEDLSVFNDERVVRAIAASAAPVVTGIGHETDSTLADFSADVRAPTPTGAAVLATPDAIELITGVEAERARMSVLVENQVAARSKIITELGTRLRRTSPMWKIGNNRQRVDDAAGRLERVLSQRFLLSKAQFTGLHNHLQSLSPLKVIQRGYALVRDAEGRLVRSMQQVLPGKQVTVRISDGEFDASVVKIHTEG